MWVSGQATHQKCPLHTGQNLHGNVARPLIADTELTSFNTLAYNFLKPLEMHLGEAVQPALHRRGDGIEDRPERSAGTHTLALTVNGAKDVEIGFKSLSRLLPLDLAHFPSHPIGGAIKHGNRNIILRGKMVIEAWFADTHLIRNVLKAEAMEAARLN
jgi:hypothetical protein